MDEKMPEEAVQEAKVVARKTEPVKRPVFLHARSGVLILALDWLIFSGNLVSGTAATPVAMIAGGILGTLGVAFCQRLAAGDPWSKSLLKGLIGGIAVGLPFPIAGTLVGGLVLTASGLSSAKRPKLPSK